MYCGFTLLRFPGYRSPFDFIEYCSRYRHLRVVNRETKPSNYHLSISEITPASSVPTTMSNQNTDPSIAKKDMIVTRNKSAQQKHQLRKKDRSMAKQTQLLKSPTKTYKNLKKKLKTLEKRSTGNRNNVTNNTRQGDMPKEYYPDKLRRKFEEKRTFLKPKYESHTVVKLNKRKLGTPQRGTTLEEMPSQSQSEDDWSSIYGNESDVFADLSMEEVVRIVEETESLDDEDLMEILTCPSPVWWEDPPDEGYIEEPIFTRKPERMQKTPRIKKSLKEKPKNLPKKENKKAEKSEKPATTDFINIVKTDDRFLKKRSKLENVLGNIKNKVNSETQNDTDDKSKDDITKESSAIEISNDRKEKRNSESTESFPDLCFNNEEMLRDLENMDIPVGINENKLVEESNLEDKELFGEEIKGESDIERVKQNESLASNVPLNLPRLTKRPKLDLQESPSVKSLSDDTELSSLSGQDNIDTISDTNIKFIIDDDVDILNENKDSLNEIRKEIASDVKSKSNEDVLKALHDKKEYITVYKIVSSDTQEKCTANKFKNIPEYSSYVENLMKQESASDDAKCNGQLNSFFKKCKFVNRKKKKELDAKATDSEESFCDTCEPKKCITVAQDENVKYCLFCSSIFDTDDCKYCIKSQNVKDDIENQA